MSEDVICSEGSFLGTIAVVTYKQHSCLRLLQHRESGTIRDGGWQHGRRTERIRMTTVFSTLFSFSSAHKSIKKSSMHKMLNAVYL